MIIQPPTNTAVFLGQSAAVFECETSGGELSGWRVNGTAYSSLSPDIRSDLDAAESVSDDDNTLITLTIPARAKYNGTRVQCVTIILGGAFDESDNVTMQIQGGKVCIWCMNLRHTFSSAGLLSSVCELTAISTATTIIISWSAPFSLDVTDVDPDIWYSVLIYNVTDNPTATPCADCINITETHYTFTPDYPSPCHKYIFTVIHSMELDRDTAVGMSLDIVSVVYDNMLWLFM